MSDPKIEESVNPVELSEILWTALEKAREPEKTIIATFIRCTVAKITELHDWKKKAELKLLELATNKSMEWIEVDGTTKAPESGVYILSGEHGVDICHFEAGDVIDQSGRFFATHASLIKVPQ